LTLILKEVPESDTRLYSKREYRELLSKKHDAAIQELRTRTPEQTSQLRQQLSQVSEIKAASLRTKARRV
jgi:hypothetical protein